jgi:hypothetical protein
MEKTTDNIDKLLTALISLTARSSDGDLSASGKFDLLQQAKEIRKLTLPAKSEVGSITDDQQDQLTLKFGEAFFKILRGK